VSSFSSAERAANRIPGTLITGFLGSGKTTLLNALLRHPGMRDTAVIVNEFGEVGLDHLLIETAFEDAVLLKSGCICCTTRGDLVDTLGDLFERRSRGAIPHFDRVVIETTGLADPAPILHMLMAEAAITERYRLDRVIATIDAANASHQLERQYESAKQAAMADRLVLTKTDLASPREIEAVTARLRALNPTAPVLRAVKGAIDPAVLFDRIDGGALRAETFEADDPHVRHDHNHDHDHEHDAHEEHLHGIASWSLTHSGPVSWRRLAAWLEALVSLRGPDLLRLKGIVEVEGRTRPMVVHGVQHVLHPASELERWPGSERGTRIVFITRDIAASALAASFRASVAQRESFSALQGGGVRGGGS